MTVVRHKITIKINSEFMEKLLLKSLALVVSVTVAPIAFAELVPVEDSDLANYSGQAMIGIDEYQVVQDNASTTDFMRITLGSTIETNTTIANLELGTYDRAGYSAASDIDIDDLRLGHIDADTGEFVPFVIEDPYMEFAFSETNSVRDVVGIRIGAGKATGSFTANINSLTGNFEMLIDHDNDVNTAPVAAQLLDSSGAATNIRATNVGVAGDCSTNCISLNNLATLNIDDSGSSSDMFLSYQNIDLKWASTLNDTSTIDTSTLINTTQGAFINLPTNMTTTTDALIGISGQNGNILPTRYTDAALGLFP